MCTFYQYFAYKTKFIHIFQKYTCISYYKNKKDEELILVTKELREKEKQLKIREEDQNRKDIDLKIREEEQKNKELKEKRRKENFFN